MLRCLSVAVLFMLLNAAHAQDSQLPIPCCTAPFESMSKELWSALCLSNGIICDALCGYGFVEHVGCIDDYGSICQCKNGTDMVSAASVYQESIPGQECLFWYSACLNASSNNPEGQRACADARDSNCPNATIRDVNPDAAVPAILIEWSEPTVPTASATILDTITTSFPYISPSILSNSRTGTSTSLSSFTSSPLPKQPEDPAPSPLSKGAIAGIVVGAVLGIAIVAAILFVCRRRRKEHDIVNTTSDLPVGYESKQTPNTAPAVYPVKAELHSHSRGEHVYAHDGIQPSNPAELYGGPFTPQPMPNQGYQGTQEMPTDWYAQQQAVPSPQQYYPTSYGPVR